jgi:aldose 1-epimerase
MRFSTDSFGTLNGKDVSRFTITNKQGMEISCINYGCIITDILVPNSAGLLESVVLGFDSLEEYLEHSPYFGAVVGRVAGRIKGSQFNLDGETYLLAANEQRNHLHGGPGGFDKVLWTATPFLRDQEAGVEFTYISPDKEEGYPGNLSVRVTYTLTEQNELIISYYGISDKTTLLNLTNHTYFNLSGNLKKDILNHELILDSDRFLELNEELLPTGKMLAVNQTVFDFRKGKKISEGLNQQDHQIELVGQGYDHPFLLNKRDCKEIQLHDPESGRGLVISTDEPSVVLYTGNMLQDNFLIRGVRSRKYLGLCLETQGLPDSIHHDHFPSCVLEEGKEYRSTTKYSFVL